MASRLPIAQDIPELRHIDQLADLLDSRFRIPGTRIRFGLDFLIGLVPYAGDLISFAISGLLVLSMARHGASKSVITKMLGNVVLDTTVGAIPILGDIFDLTYKANRRNVRLLKEHYHEGRHTGSVWKVLVPVLIVLLLLFALMVYLVYLLVSWTATLFVG